MECSELEAAGRVQYEALQQETVTLWQRLIASHPDVVLAVLGHAFESSSANAAPLGVWDTEAHLVLLAPDLAALPERYPTTTAAGNLSLRKFTKGEMADLYKQLVAGLVLATAKETFSVAPGVTGIRIVVLRNTSADAYGKIRPEAILAARIARAALNGGRHHEPGSDAFRRASRYLLHRGGSRGARLAGGCDLRHFVPSVPHPARRRRLAATPAGMPGRTARSASTGWSGAAWRAGLRC
jgi:hypothetical protein